MEYLLIKIDTPEWCYMWDYLEKHPISEDIENPSISLNNGESWQYTGSYKEGDKIIHTMRHKSHPKTNNIYYLNFEASNIITDDSIEKVIKLK